MYSSDMVFFAAHRTVSTQFNTIYHAGMKRLLNDLPHLFQHITWLYYLFAKCRYFEIPGGKISTKLERTQSPRDFFSLWQTVGRKRRAKSLLAPGCLFLLVCLGWWFTQGPRVVSLKCDSVAPPPLWRRWPLLNSLAGIWTAPLSWDALSCGRHQRELRGSQWTYFREISKNLNAFMCLNKEGCFQWLVLTEPVK